MKRFYSKSRIGLMTFAIGLASVFMLNSSLKVSEEVPVKLPQIKSGNSINVFVLKKPKRILCTIESDGYCYCSPHSKGVAGGCSKLNEFFRLKDIKDEENGVF